MTRRPQQLRRNRTRDLFLWLNTIKADRDLPASAFLVAFEIGQHFNAKHGGAAWPSSHTIASNIGIGKATVIRVVRQLREHGYLKIDPGKAGRGHSNQYFMALRRDKKRSTSEPFSATIKGPFETRKGPPVDLIYLEPSMGASKEAPHRGERVGSLALTIPAGALRLNGGAPEAKGSGLPSKQEPENSDQWFPKLRGIWARPWADDDEAGARRAFAMACTEADPAEILASARLWAAAVEPRYLQALPKWLAGHGWEKSPPQRRQRNGSKPALAEMMLKWGSST